MPSLTLYPSGTTSYWSVYLVGLLVLYQWSCCIFTGTCNRCVATATEIQCSLPVLKRQWRKICQLTIPTHQFWRLVQFCDCRRPVRVFVCSSSEVLILTTPTHRFIKMWHAQLFTTTIKRVIIQARSLFINSASIPQIRPIGTCCTYSYASWCYTQWEINSPFAKQKHPWLYFCYVLQSSPSSLFFYVAPQINFYLQGRGSGSSCARINDSPACLIYIPRPNFWHALRLATAAERVRKRSVDQSGQAVLWAKICFCCEPCSCIFEI